MMIKDFIIAQNAQKKDPRLALRATLSRRGEGTLLRDHCDVRGPCQTPDEDVKVIAPLFGG